MKWRYPDILKDCFGRSVRVVKRFMSTTWDTRSVNLIIWVLLLIWFLIILGLVRKKSDKDVIMSNLIFLKKSAILSAFLLLVTYGPFLYPSAPAVYVHLNQFFVFYYLRYYFSPTSLNTVKAAWLCVESSGLYLVLMIYCWILLLGKDGAL